MNRIGQNLTHAMTVAGVIVVAALICITTIGAVGRYLQVPGLTWSYEAVGILFLWTTAIGTVLSEIVGENVSIDGNTADSGRGPRFQLYHAVVLLMVAAAFIWSGRALLMRTAFNPTPVMRLPSWIMHSTIVFMGVALAMIAVLRIVLIFRELRR